MLDACGYCSVEYDLISQVYMERAIGALNAYLRKLPDGFTKKIKKKSLGN